MHIAHLIKAQMFHLHPRVIHDERLVILEPVGGPLGRGWLQLALQEGGAAQGNSLVAGLVFEATGKTWKMRIYILALIQ